MTPDNYSYENWWSGDFIIRNSEEMIINSNISNYVDWEQIAESEQSLIRAKQKDLFWDSVNRKLEQAKADFLGKYPNSKQKQVLVREMREACHDILFGSFPGKGVLRLKYFDTVTIEAWKLFRIQQYAKEVIKGGKTNHYDYIQSPNSKLFSKDGNILTLQAYAQFWWEFYEWLGPYEVLQSSKVLEESNPHPNIFLNTNSFMLCNRFLQELGVKYTNVSFIYYKMRLLGLVHQQSESAFRLWIDKHYGIYFKSTLKMDESKTGSKKKIAKFDDLLREIKPLK